MVTTRWSPLRRSISLMNQFDCGVLWLFLGHFGRGFGVWRQEKSEELTRFLQELDAQSQGAIPSAVKDSKQAFPVA